jgi:ubiquitin-protein ligase
MEKGPLPWASAGPVGDNLYKWKAVIEGPVRHPTSHLRSFPLLCSLLREFACEATMTLPIYLSYPQEKTPYEKGSFSLELEMPPEYPFKAPKVPASSCRGACISSGRQRD